MEQSRWFSAAFSLGCLSTPAFLHSRQPEWRRPPADAVPVSGRKAYGVWGVPVIYCLGQRFFFRRCRERSFLTWQWSFRALSESCSRWCSSSAVGAPRSKPRFAVSDLWRVTHPVSKSAVPSRKCFDQDLGKFLVLEFRRRYYYSLHLRRCR